MCIAVPVRILDVDEGKMPMGHVDHDGVSVSCCFAYTPQAQVGHYAIVQNGFAIDVMDAETAAKSLELFAEIAAMNENTELHVNE
ncbi:MAG: HypC/HybG/HupF family hydrogenase formation chaperone [Propionibacteriaceae bacterium]|nr:HypC/HybG/HupF family hydrogenase formation chaperone [Propionibacteriaceae bacterium]